MEKGFGFLKHPEFLASSLFLKKSERIMAWIFHCFVGIHTLFQEGQCVGIVNLEERHWKIITLSGYQA